MNDNSPSIKCPKCGAPLTADTVEGLCPACLLALNLATQTQWTGDTVPPGPKTSKANPPSPEEIAQSFPQFEIIRCLGRGGMGVVYQARQKSLDRTVALKILAPEREKDPKFAERFAREAKTLALLNHQNIVTIHDFGEAGGMFYLVMEFVDGINLRQLLSSGRLSPSEAVAIVPPICDALQYAHEHGIVHRDIKPENILLDKQGRVKIADFGIARLMGAETEPDLVSTDTTGIEANLTAKKVMGTPHYMAPEQARHPSEVDHRADIYSMGVVFYEMLTGELPKEKLQPPSHKVQIDVRIDEIVLRALSQDPELRYKNANEVKTMVETLATTPMNTKSPVSSTQDYQPSPAQQLSMMALGGAACVLFFAVVMLWWLIDPGLQNITFFPKTRGQIFFTDFMVPLAFVALLPATLLGWIAASQIRHAAGRLYGLGLAVFDGLFVPIAGLDLLVFVLWVWADKVVASWRGLGGSMFHGLWEMGLWTLIFGLMTGWLNYLMLRFAWRAVTKTPDREITPEENAHTRRNLINVCIAIGLATALLVPCAILVPESIRKSQIGYGVQQGNIHYRVFEAEGARVDQLIPSEMRELPKTAKMAQTAQLDAATLASLMQDVSTNSALLANKHLDGSDIYQKEDGWNYGGASGFGSGEGGIGLSQKNNSLQLRAYYVVKHSTHGALTPLVSTISYQGIAPATNCARAFLFPFQKNEKDRYLVVTFETSGKLWTDEVQGRGKKPVGTNSTKTR